MLVEMNWIAYSVHAFVEIHVVNTSVGLRQSLAEEAFQRGFIGLGVNIFDEDQASKGIRRAEGDR